MIVGEPVEQLRPQLGLAVHQRLGAGVVLARPALDEVAGERERRAGEADERRRAELADERAHRLGDVRDVVGRQRGQPVEVGGGAERLRDDRPDARDDVEVDADRLERHDDVGEEDRRVDAVAADRLQRDLGDEVGGRAGVEHLVALAELAVLGQRPAGLAHEPHRRVRDGLAAARPEEGGVVRGGGRSGHPLDRPTRLTARLLGFVGRGWHRCVRRGATTRTRRWPDEHPDGAGRALVRGVQRRAALRDAAVRGRPRPGLPRPGLRRLRLTRSSSASWWPSRSSRWSSSQPDGLADTPATRPAATSGRL